VEGHGGACLRLINAVKDIVRSARAGVVTMGAPAVRELARLAAAAHGEARELADDAAALGRGELLEVAEHHLPARAVRLLTALWHAEARTLSEWQLFKTLWPADARTPSEWKVINTLLEKAVGAAAGPERGPPPASPRARKRLQARLRRVVCDANKALATARGTLRGWRVERRGKLLSLKKS